MREESETPKTSRKRVREENMTNTWEYYIKYRDEIDGVLLTIQNH